MDELKKILLAGLGSIAYTYEKSSTFVEELVQKGKLTVDEGKELSQELKRNFKDKSDEISNKIMPLTKEDLKSVLEEMDFVTLSDFNELKEKVNKLEAKVESLDSTNL